MEIFFLFQWIVTRNRRMIYCYNQSSKNGIVFVRIFTGVYKTETYL